MNQAQAQEVLNLFDQAMVDQHNIAKWYVDGEIDQVTASFEEKLGSSAQELDELRSMHQLFYSAVDAADLTEDGQINLKSTMESILAQVGINQTAVQTNLTKLGNLEALINKEISDRIAQGKSLTSVIDTLRSNLQDQITKLSDRLTAVEAKAAGAVEFIETLVTGAPGATANALARVKAVYGYDDDVVIDPVLNV